MTILKSARRERFAQAVARGTRPPDAFIAAGYKPNRNSWTLMKNKLVKKRIAEIEKSLADGGSRELGPLIDELLKLARKAASLEDGAGLPVARQFYAEAARLKLLLPVDIVEEAPRPFNRREALALELTFEEHAKLFPPDP